MLAWFDPGDYRLDQCRFEEITMAKGQKKSNREKKKPKQDKKLPQPVPGQSAFGKKVR